jgi:hypothetical protein
MNIMRKKMDQSSSREADKSKTGENSIRNPPESNSSNHLDILQQLDSGEIDINAAVRMLEDAPDSEVSQATSGISQAPDAEKDVSQKMRFNAWLVMFGTGVGISALGGWLASIGGWWWLFAGPLLFLGLTVLILAVLALNSPWVHFHINTGQEEWPQRIKISIPLPIKAASWGLRIFGSHISGLDETAVDEILLALDGLRLDETPACIEVNQENSGEKIQVYFC